MTRVLVTGGAGYLGSTLVPALLDRGFHVTVVDSFIYGQDSLAAVCYRPEFGLVRGDVRSMETMRPLLKNADIIIPLAALVGAPLCDRDPLAATSTNLTAIVQMLDHISRDQPLNPKWWVQPTRYGAQVTLTEFSLVSRSYIQLLYSHS